jgi:type IV pilus assembly protein PilB
MAAEAVLAPVAVPRRAAPRRSLLGGMLIAHGIVTPEQLEEALEKVKGEKGTRLGRLLVDLGYATELQITQALAEQLRIPTADLAAVDVAPDVLSRVSKDLAVQHRCLPWFVEGKELYVITPDPTDVAALDAIAFHTGFNVRPAVAPESEVESAIARFYATEQSIMEQLDSLDLAQQLQIVLARDEDLADEGPEAADGTALVKLVNAILADAVRARASDIHLEPQQKEMVVRYRVDGLLRQIMAVPKRIQTKLISRIKVVSHMDISERRKPQDGRMFIRAAGESYDLRVSSLPTADGEKIVIRVLAQNRAQVTLEELSFDPDVLKSFTDLLQRPQGIVLVTGPTCSGKTSTLYAALNFLRSKTTNITTVEDPVEYRLPGVNQVAVSDKVGLSFAAGLRSILRQDPDVIMVGEIRDAETAQTAFQAAQTGRLVLSTLHTNDAPSAVTRLVEIGVPAYVVASSLIGVVAQRLVRRLCDCKTPNPDGSASLKGCEACRYTGFKGRMAVFEVMRMTPRLRSVVVARGSDDLVRRAAQAAGMRTLAEDARRKAERGLTTFMETARVVPPDETEDAPAPEGGAEPAPEASPSQAAAARRGPARILVVDDEPTMVDVVREILEAESYVTVGAANGREALALIQKEAPDLVLTDLLMPGMSGLDLLKRMRADRASRHIPVVFLSGVDEVDTEVQALDLGADDYVTKPIEGLRLLGRVRRSLFRSGMMRGQ